MKKKNILIGTLTAAVALCAAASLAVEPVSSSAAVAANPLIGTTNTGWTTVAHSKNVYAEDGYTEINTLQGWGTRSYRNEKVHFDGLTVNFWMNTSNGDAVGFYFGLDTGSDYVTALTVTNWNNIYSGQNRLHISNTHNYNQASIVYETAACEETGFAAAASHVSDTEDIMGYSVTFESYNDSLYQVSVAMLYGTAWGNNAGCSASDRVSEVYLPKTSVASLLDANGDTYLFAYGFPSEGNGNPPCSINVKVEDDYTRKYQEESVAPATTKAEAYAAAVASLSTEDDYNAANLLREDALTAVNVLKAWEKEELMLTITAADEALAVNPNVVTIIKNQVLEKVTTAQNAFDAFGADEDTLTNTNYNSAISLSNAAKAEFTNKKTMLDEAAVAEVDAAIEKLDYSADYYKALQWVIAYETEVAAIDIQSATIGSDIAAVNATKNAYAGSETETLVNAMNATDKANVQARIDAANNSLATLEAAVSSDVKTAYLVTLEVAVKADLTVYSNIENAFEKLETLRLNVTIEEADGELYTRYTTAVTDLNTALETYLTTAISAVNTLMDDNVNTLDKYLVIKAKFDKISIALLNDACENKDSITAAYEALEQRVNGDRWAGISATNVSLVEKNDEGIYFEMTPAFPNRINYNKALNMAEGIEIELDLTYISYYNGDLTDSGSPKGANNLCINFLNAPDAYKGSATGMSVIVWLYTNNASVQIVNNNDGAMVSASIQTPIDGGRLSISLVHGTEDGVGAYILTVNEARLVLTEAKAASANVSISDECYFSFGSFADYTAYKNCFTLVSINDTVWAEDIAQPELPEKPATDTDNTDSDNTNSDNTDSDNTNSDNTDSDGGDTQTPTEEDGGCSSSVGSVLATVLIAIAFLAVWKKRETQK
ncbi:MAG: hypothetical protein IJ329_02450 [Clostridia bacterium]|nr:hypothetical protein [Clostridia bacterium]